MKNIRSGFRIAMFAAVILLLLQIVPAALAQDYDHDDPPTRAGRIGYVEGSVSFQPGGAGDWLEAVPNRPLTVGDNLWVDRDSRAEIQLGSTSLRLGPETSITFLDLGNNVTQLRLSVGSLVARVRRYDRDDAFEVDTPNLAFNVNRPGEYRLDVNQNGDQTIATVWRGDAEVSGSSNSYRLSEGQRGVFSGVDQLSYDVDEIGSRDSFDRWVMARDERQDRVRSSQYISTEMTGYQDLDDYGRWQYAGDYGNVWVPTGVPVGWAPYRYGHWAYVYPWGWTWVEDEPWGFAPFHYGRWAFIGSSWCWVPGPVAVVPVYAPALVAFVGGGGFSVGIGVGGGVGWFPLAPGEVFVPWYRTSPRYVQTVNVTNTRVSVTQVTNVYNNYTVNKVTNVTYVNQRVNNSVTVVNHDTFVNARPVARNIVRVDSRQIAQARVTPALVTTVQPERQSVGGVARPMNVRPPQQAITRPVIATRQPVATTRPSEVPNVGRATPAPIRTVRAVPAAEAQPLQRGARGTAVPARTEAAPRGGAPENRPEPGRPEPGRPSMTENPNAPRPGAPENRPEGANGRNVPRPGAPENNRNMERGGMPANNPAPSPNAPENRPGADNRARPGAPVNNRDVTPRSGAHENAPEAATPHPNAPPRPSAPENKTAPPRGARENSPEGRSGQVPRPPSAREQQSSPNSSAEPIRQNPRSETARPQETPRAQEPARQPETRQAPVPRPEPRSEPAPRSETQQAEPPQRENHQGQPQAQTHNEKGNSGGDKSEKSKDKDKDKEPPRNH